jgi:hypothetical protein
MQISQILLSDTNSELSPFLRFATSTIDTSFPRAEHVLYDKLTLREFIDANYGGAVLWAYDKLRPYAYKADLGRYCLLNKIGGWYFDIAVRIANPVEIDPPVRFLAFRDIQRFSCTTWACANSAFYSQPNNSALQIAIEQYYGITPLCPTGPALLGKALAMNGSQPDFVYGDHIALTPQYKHTNNAYVLPDGSILAWGKPCRGGDLTSLGASGVNDYNEMWHAKNVYADV